MRTFIILSTLLIFVKIGYNQDLIYYQKESNLHKIVSVTGDTIAIVIVEKKSLILDVLTINTKISFNKSGYKEFLGGFINGDNIIVFLLHRNGKKALLLNYNINTRVSQIKIIINFLQSKEMFVAAFSNNRKIILVYKVKSKPAFNVYLFDRIGNYSVKSYKFNIFYFLSDRYLYTKDEVLKPGNNSVKLENQLPEYVFQMAYPVKIYFYKNKIYIALDIYRNRSSVLIMDINSGEKTVRVISESLFQNNDMVKTNSHIYQDKLYQFTMDKDKWVISQYDLSADSLLHKIIITKDSLSKYIDSQRYLIGGGSINDSAKQTHLEGDMLFNKISKKEPLIFVSKIYDDKIEMVIGGFVLKPAAFVTGAYNTDSQAIDIYGNSYMTLLYFVSQFNIDTFHHIDKTR